MKNPSWQRDELILALDLYFKNDYNKLSASHPDVIAISKILTLLPIIAAEDRAKSFRNPESVYMKLGNFLAIDPTDSRRGLPRYGKLDKEVFYEFKDNKERLDEIASFIKQEISNDKAIYHQFEQLSIVEDDEDAYATEGKILLRIHKIRERDPKIIKNKKAQVLRQKGKLECEVCGFDFKQFYGPLGDGFIECHHIKPISQMNSGEKTNWKDLALVCSNCHRMLHRKMTLPINELKLLINSK